MKKIREYAPLALWCLPAVFAAILILIPVIEAQEVQPGAVTVVFTNRTLSTTYLFSDSLNLESYDSVYVLINIGTTNVNDVAKIKPQWSHDDSAYFDEPILTQGTTVGSETPYTVTSRVIQINMWGATNSYPERYRRLGKFLRFAVASTNVTTSGKLSISGKKENNQN